jgi:hypothetical protein
MLLGHWMLKPKPPSSSLDDVQLRPAGGPLQTVRLRIDLDFDYSVSIRQLAIRPAGVDAVAQLARRPSAGAKGAQ